MKLGLLADVHEDVESLQRALRLLQGEGVDRLVLLGDVFEANQQLEPTIELLREANVGGVWGNHDLGLSFDPSDSVRQRYAPEVLDYFGRLQGRLVIEDVLITHASPLTDPTDPVEFYTAERPYLAENVPAAFAGFSERVGFCGHFHRWFAAMPDGLLPWGGETPLQLGQRGRFLIGVHAVTNGWCATYETRSGHFVPISLG